MARIDVIKNLFSSALQLNPCFQCNFLPVYKQRSFGNTASRSLQTIIIASCSGVNIGGVGTLIASLASLITLSKYNLALPR